MDIEYNNIPTKFNVYQSTLEQIDFYNLPDEVRTQFLDIIKGIKFVNNLISPNRPHVKTLDRDDKGRAIIDLSNPPLYDDVDIFRPVGKLYEEKGILNPYKPNPAKQSDYYKWEGTNTWHSWVGKLDPNTGMWIPGDMYWYLNYCMIDVITTNEDGIDETRTTVPCFWEGQWWRFLGWYYARLNKENFAEIAGRRKGKSNCAAARACRDFYIGESENHQTNVKDLFVADNAQYLNNGGVLNLFEGMIDFVAQHCNRKSLRLDNSLNDMRWVSGYRDLATKTKKGSLNQVLGITISDDPDKPRGKAANFIYFEEFGNFNKLQKTYDTTMPSIKQGNKVRGIIVAAGTGGTEGANFQGALDMIYHPKAYNMYDFKNVYDLTPTESSIFFFPAYVNYEGRISKNGISDVTGALRDLLVERYRKKYYASNIATLTQFIAEYPITIQDSIMKVGNTVFPTAMLNDRILELDSTPGIFDDIYVGKLNMNNDGKVKFIPTNDIPIRDFHSHGDSDRNGAVEIYVMPQKDKTGNVPYGRYLLSLDPIDSDNEDDKSLSLQSCFVFDLWTDTIVAEYTGRTHYAVDFYEQVRLLCIFYNGLLMYENNLKGVFSYFQRMNSLHYMAETPQYLVSKGLQQRYTIGNKKYGIHNMGGINSTGIEYLRDWLMSPIVQIVHNKELNKDEEITVYKLQTLKNRALLQELAEWNTMGNFDRVSSMIIMMLYREEKLIVKGTSDWESLNKNNTWSDDKFLQQFKPKDKNIQKTNNFYEKNVW